MFVLLEVNLINGLMHLKHAIKHRHHCKESTCLGPWVPKYLSIQIPNRNSGPDYTFVHWLQPWRNKFIPPCFNTFVFNLSVNKMADLQWIGFMISCHNIASSGWIFIPNHRFRGLSDHPPPPPTPLETELFIERSLAVFGIARCALELSLINSRVTDV